MGDEELVLGVWVRGPLAICAVGFGEFLVAQGYTPGSAGLQIHLVAQLSRWLGSEGLGVGDLSESVMDRFIAVRRQRVDRLFRSRRALEPIADYLQSVGMLPRCDGGSAVTTPVEVLLERYRRYLLIERALTVQSAHLYVNAVRPFLAEFERGACVETVRITAGDVSAFVLMEANRRPGTSIRSVATALRSLLGFLHVEGMLERSLTGAVPGVGAWRSAGLPRPLASDAFARLLGSFDRQTPLGRRDFAIVVLLGRLGLRSAEVAGLALEDIDWRSGELVIYGKGHRDDRLPLPVDVGDAIAAYLHEGRPVTAQGRVVFVRTLAPHHALSPSAVSMVPKRAAERAGLGHLRSHQLRHTAGTELLRAGATLSEVGQVLRHRRLISTAIYAKVDDHALRQLARPWPEDLS